MTDRVDGLDSTDATRRDSTIERETIERAIGHPSSPRAVVVGEEGAISIRARSRDRSRVDLESLARAFESCVYTYLGDDGGASGDALLRARGSRRERDQSGVQRQGDHDCVCVTSRVESLIHSFMFTRAGGRTRVVETDRPTRYGSGLSKIVPHPCPRRDPLHFIPSPSRSRSRWGVVW